MWPVTFTHAWALWLGAGAVLPLIIHFFSRQRARVIRFPGVQFIQRSRRRSFRRTRFKHLLLLLLRMLLIVLFAFLIARPVLRRGAAAAEAGAEGTPAAVLILDDSLSMTFRAGGLTPFDTARNRALELLAQMPAGVAAGVMSTSHPRGKLMQDLDALAGRVTGMRPTTGSSSCWGALEAAAEMLAQKGASRRDVFLFTDMTRSAWQGSEYRHVEMGPDVRVHVVDCSTAGVNGAVCELLQEGEPAVVGAALGLKAQVVASGGPMTRTVQFELDGQVMARRGVDLEAGSRETLSFSAVLSRSGHHWGRVSFLNPDGLAHDDSRSFALDVSPEVSVLCVEDRPELGLESVSYFLRLALNPWGEGRRGVFRIERAGPAKLDELSLGPFDVVVLAGAGRMSETGWRRLAAYVSGGGGLLVFLGPETDDAYRSDGALGLLPAQVGPVVVAPAGSPFGIRIIKADHPFVAGLTASEAELAEIRYRQCRRLRPGEGGVELMSFGPDNPALVVGGAGDRVAVFAGTADERWGNFPSTPAFVPFCHEMVMYLAGRTAAGIRSFPVAAQVPIVFETSRWPTVVYVTSPGAKQRERLLPGTTPGRQTYWKTDSPGYYRVDFERRDTQWQGGFAVNTAPIESFLEPVAFEQVQDHIGAGQVTLVSEASFAEGEMHGGGGPGELTPYLALVALGLLLAECFLANRFYKPAAAPSQAPE